MIFELLITRRAQLDLDEIFIWYEEQQPGLGDRFLNAFEDAIIKIKRNPYYASNIASEAKSVFLKKFPYDVIYYIDENRNQIRIIAIIHQHRSKTFFKERLKE